MDQQEQATKEQIQYVLKRIGDQIGYLDGAAGLYSHKSFRLRMWGAVLSAGTTVLIGTGRVLLPEACSIVALITSSAVGVLLAWEAFYGYGDKRVTHRNTAQLLRRMRSDLEYAQASPEAISQQKLEEMRAKLENALQETYSDVGGSNQLLSRT